jgi:hypothetical protein
MRFLLTWAAAPLVAGLFALACCFAADPAQKEASAPAPKRDLIVHEWGTFSTFSGSDGKNLEFYPYDNDLPEFVHAYIPRNAKKGPNGGTISLETPVIYFYSEKALTATAKVEFPKGTITEWYPWAERTDKKLAWQKIKVLPQEEVKLPNEKQESRYYAARETDAAPLRVTFKEENKKGTEEEKFLFYRGVGTFDMPLSVRAAANGKFTVTWKGSTPDSDAILVRVQAGKIRFQQFSFDSKSASADVKVPDNDSTSEKLGEALVKLLTDKGLFEKEARAMVKTWSSAWFGEEGTRVLYFLPRGLTDELLPLRVEPKPDALVRVLVGRHDVLTPEREKQIDSWVIELTRENAQENAKLRAAREEMEKLGRYQGAAWNAAQARLKRGR